MPNTIEETITAIVVLYQVVLAGPSDLFHFATDILEKRRSSASIYFFRFPCSAQVRIERVLAAVAEARQQRQARGEPDIPLGDALREVIARADFSPRELNELWYAINSAIEHEYAADVDGLSLYHWDEPYEFDGDEVIFPQGYDALAYGLADGLDVRLDHIVAKIAHDEPRVRVTTNREVFEAERVVVTLPLGVLKRGAVEFSPALPLRKQQAIARLGMNVLNKVYLRFAESVLAGRRHGLARLCGRAQRRVVRSVEFPSLHASADLAVVQRRRVWHAPRSAQRRGHHRRGHAASARDVWRGDSRSRRVADYPLAERSLRGRIVFAFTHRRDAGRSRRAGGTDRQSDVLRR